MKQVFRTMVLLTAIVVGATHCGGSDGAASTSASTGTGGTGSTGGSGGTDQAVSEILSNDFANATNWTVVGTGAVVAPTGYSAQAGDKVYEFTQLGTGFGDTKLDYCVQIDRTKTTKISYSVRPNTGTATSSTRLSASGTGYYTDATCTTADNSLNSFPDYDTENLTDGQWKEISKVIPPAGGSAATHFKFSIRAKDASACTKATTAGGCFAFDKVRVHQNMHKISGTVSGLTGTLVLQNNSGNDLTVNSGASTFEFTKRVKHAYAVTVKTQPAGQVCSIKDGSGNATEDVSTMSIKCGAPLDVGGTITGLSAGSVKLALNTEASQSFSASGTYTLSAKLATGADYSVAVKEHPVGHYCFISNETGSAASANVTNVNISCRTSLITNHSFEGPSKTGWEVNGTGDAVNPTGYTAQAGNDVFEFTALTTGFGGAKIDFCLPIDENKPTKVLLRARSNTGDNSAEVRVAASSYGYYKDSSCTSKNKNGTKVGDHDLGKVKNGEWTTLNVDIPANGHADSNYMKISFRSRHDVTTSCNKTTGNGGCFAFDNLVLVQE